MHFSYYSQFYFIYMTFCLVLWLGVRGRSWNRYFSLDVVHSFSFFFFINIIVYCTMYNVQCTCLPFHSYIIDYIYFPAKKIYIKKGCIVLRATIYCRVHDIFSILTYVDKEIRSIYLKKEGKGCTVDFFAIYILYTLWRFFFL